MDFTPETAQQVLSLGLPARSDFGSVTIRQAFVRLMSLLWDDTEGFNGYRPLGNSDWSDQIIAAVVDAGLAADEDEAGSVIR